MLLSDRGIPLILQEIQNVPTLTVENYCKWYDTFIVHPDGSVTSGCDFYSKYTDQFEGAWCGDHVFNPEFIQRLEDSDIGIVVCPRSFEMIMGRWQLEHLGLSYNTSMKKFKKESSSA